MTANKTVIELNNRKESITALKQLASTTPAVPEVEPVEAPCCNKVYVCRLCHDDEESHEIDRKAVKVVLCLQCGNEQEVQKTCAKCSVTFGEYYCDICHLFDDKDRQQFHCGGCGICRVGGKENFFHCEKCDMCYGITLKNNHKCVEKSSHNKCPVCLEDLHSSRVNYHMPPCNHLLHVTCFRNLLKNGTYACPICNQSMVEMNSTWKYLDEEVAGTPMPDEYKDFYVQILCRDCHKESKVKFHVIGLKCSHCPSYNTCRTAEAEESEHAPTTANEEPSV